MYELQYSKPSSVNDAVAEIKKSSDAKFLAGGMTMMNADADVDVVTDTTATCAGPKCGSKRQKRKRNRRNKRRIKRSRY